MSKESTNLVVDARNWYEMPMERPPARGNAYLRLSRMDKMREYARELEERWLEGPSCSNWSEAIISYLGRKGKNIVFSSIEALESAQPVGPDRSRQRADAPQPSAEELQRMRWNGPCRVAERQRSTVAAVDRERVVAALEDPHFKWRTINGISEQTGF
jgi:hypothetical protein